jgi:hypothetical protein
MRKLFTISFFFFLLAPSGAFCQAAKYRILHDGNLTAIGPDLAVTPGLTRPDATVAQVCHGGSTKQFRLTTAKMKADVYKLYAVRKKPGVCCEVDHVVSLELGGADDEKNLFPQPYLPRPGAHEKDAVENYLHAQVCGGKMTLGNAQKAIISDWLKVYVQNVQVKK